MADPGRRSFTLLLVATVGTFAGYSLLLPVVPLWAKAGGAGSTGAGATTAVFMLTTVATQLAMPALLNRFGARELLVCGSAIMSVLSAMFAVSSDLWFLIVVSAGRGVGFGLVTVTGSLLIGVLLPEDERGRGSGRYGAAVGLPHVMGLPAGVWLAEHVGYLEVFVAAGGTGVVGTLLTLLVRIPGGQADTGRPAKRPRLPDRGLYFPSTVMIAISVATGGVVTFLAVALRDAGVVAWALFVFGLCMIIGRWSAGAMADRLRRTIALGPGAVLATAGMACLAAGAGGASSVVALAGAALFGAGFGAVQSDTLIILFQRAGQHRIGEASAVWNIAYDGGFGIGAIGVGALAAATDFGAAFAVTAIVIAAAFIATHVRRQPSK